MITLSRNEIRAEVEKAIRGAGANWGQAKDGGVMAAYLAGHNLPFLGTVTRCLDLYDGAGDGDTLLAPLNGVMVAEYVAATGQPFSGAVTAIRFLVAAMGIVADEHRAALCLDDADGRLAYAEGGALYLRPGGLDGGDRHLRLTAATSPEGQLELCRWSEETAVTASRECWRKLGGYAFKTYVKETEEKRRAGAGAGDIDNS